MKSLKRKKKLCQRLKFKQKSFCYDIYKYFITNIMLINILFNENNIFNETFLFVKGPHIIYNSLIICFEDKIILLIKIFDNEIILLLKKFSDKIILLIIDNF